MTSQAVPAVQTIKLPPKPALPTQLKHAVYPPLDGGYRIAILQEDGLPFMYLDSTFTYRPHAERVCDLFNGVGL